MLCLILLLIEHYKAKFMLIKIKNIPVLFFVKINIYHWRRKTKCFRRPLYNCRNQSFFLKITKTKLQTINYYQSISVRTIFDYFFFEQFLAPLPNMVNRHRKKISLSAIGLSANFIHIPSATFIVFEFISILSKSVYSAITLILIHQLDLQTKYVCSIIYFTLLMLKL